MSGRPLGDILRDLKRGAELGLADLTVLSSQNDPFRLDTPAFHEAGRWLRDQMQACRLLGRGRPIHNRGIHYAIVARGDVRLPSGKPYVNDADCWSFLETRASKASRWLGYVPFDAIIDARNSEPIIRISERPAFAASIKIEAALYLPRVDEIKPKVSAKGFMPRQPFKLVFFGEKTSLDSVLGPLADECDADLYLPSGEISDTMLWRMASTGAADGREMVVLVFTDCDPAGYQMAVSIAHKLRAFRECLYPSLAFRVLTPALTVEQVQSLGLPSTPLKATELRADGWRAKHGIEQTEIDALATLQPETLRRIAREAIAPFFDSTLRRRSNEARWAWEEAAQEVFDAAVDSDRLSAIYSQATADLEALREKLDALEMAVDDYAIELPEFTAPEPILTDAPAAALVSSDMPLLEAIRTLKDRKRYSAGDGGSS